MLGFGKYMNEELLVMSIPIWWPALKIQQLDHMSISTYLQRGV